MPRFSIITTCKGRVHHLKQSLPRFLAQRDSEVIVVDYDCPDGTGDYVRREHPEARVVAVENAPIFNISDARNRGAAVASGDWLVFLDADVIVSPDVIERISGVLEPQGRFYGFVDLNGPEKANFNLFGSCVVRAADFVAAGRYDSVMEGYGEEDQDLYGRLERMKLVRHTLSPGLVESVLDHGIEERTQFHKRKSTLGPTRINAAYRVVKLGLLRAYDVPELPEELRRKIYDLVRRRVKEAFMRNETVVKLTLPLPDDRGDMFGWEWQAKRQMSFELNLKQSEAAAESSE